MMDFFKVKDSDVPLEHDYVKAGNVHVIVNGIPVGLVQELIITERKGIRSVQIDMSRILDSNNTLEKVLGINSNAKLKLEVTEDQGDHLVHFEFNECEVERISRCYNAEKFFTVEDCSIISSSYYKDIKAK